MNTKNKSSNQLNERRLHGNYLELPAMKLVNSSYNQRVNKQVDNWWVLGGNLSYRGEYHNYIREYIEIEPQTTIDSQSTDWIKRWNVYVTVVV